MRVVVCCQCCQCCCQCCHCCCQYCCHCYVTIVITIVINTSINTTNIPHKHTTLPLIHLATDGMNHREPILQVSFKRRWLEESVFHLPILQTVGTGGVQTLKGVDALLPPLFGGLSIIHLTQRIEYVEFHVLLDLLVISILSLEQEVVTRNEHPRGSTTE